MKPTWRNASSTPCIKNCTTKSARGKKTSTPLLNSLKKVIYTFQKDRFTIPIRVPSRTIHLVAHCGVGSVSNLKFFFREIEENFTHAELIHCRVVFKEPQNPQSKANKDDHPNGSRKSLDGTKFQRVPMILG